jgi:NitT/TauT family transport system substrate-binding protein
MRNIHFSKFCGALVASAIALSSTAHAVDLKMIFAMPTTPAPYLLPYFVANDLGWLAKDGLTVDEKVVTGDTNCMRAVLTGDADTTLIGPNTIMQAIVSGGEVKIIGSLQPVVDYQIVARKEAGTDLKELANKKWAIASVGGMTQALPRMVMKKHGIDSSSTQFISAGGLAARYQALAAGKADATLLDVQLALRGEREGRTNIVQAVSDDFPDMGYVFFPVKTSELKDQKQREALQIFIRDGIRGVRYVLDHPDEAAKILAKRMKIDDVASLTETIKKINTLGVWGVNGGINRDVLEFSEKVYRESGDVTKDVSYDQMVDTSLVDASLKTLGKR